MPTAEEFYYALRIFLFVWAFLLFGFMIYGFILDRVVSSHCSRNHVPLEMHFWMAGAFMAVLGTLFGLSVVLTEGLPGGPQAFAPLPFLIPSTIATFHAMFRVRMHKIAIEHGACK